MLVVDNLCKECGLKSRPILFFIFNCQFVIVFIARHILLLLILVSKTIEPKYYYMHNSLSSIITQLG